MPLLYDKTDKGRDEIATRRFQLAPRLRTLLLIIDGKQSTEDLLKKVLGIGLEQEHVSQLIEQGFIQQIEFSTAPEAVAPSVAASTPAAVPLAPSAAINFQDQPLPAQPIQQIEQFRSLYAFFNRTIRDTIGLRGFTLQLKVERANSIDDFRALRQPYLDAILKAGGADVQRRLRHELDALLVQKPVN